MDKIDQEIIEAITSVVNPDTTDRDTIVSDYVQSYFDDALNEGTVDADDIMEAFIDLLETADAVRDFIIEFPLLKTRQAAMRGVKKTGSLAKKGAHAAGKVLDSHPSMQRLNQALPDKPTTNKPTTNKPTTNKPTTKPRQPVRLRHAPRVL